MRIHDLLLAMPGSLPGCASGLSGAIPHLHDDVCVEPELPHGQCVHHGPGQPAGVLPALCHAGAQSGDGWGLDVGPLGHPGGAPVSALTTLYILPSAWNVYMIIYRVSGLCSLKLRIHRAMSSIPRTGAAQVLQYR